MSYSKPIQEWWRADITFKSYSDGTTKTIKFISREAVSETETYFPLLISASGLGALVGQDGMPTASSASISIADHWYSFGAERKVSDLLERYTPLEQAVTVYSCRTRISDTSPHSDFSAVWSGVVKSMTRSAGSDATLDFSVETGGIDQRYLVKTIDESMAESGYSAPENSLGKTIPLIFGTGVNVPAYCVSNNPLSARYAYGVQMSSTFPMGGATAFYARDDEGVYQRIYDAGSDYIGAAGGAGSYYPTSYGRTQMLVPAYWLQTSGTRFIITGLRWWMKGQSPRTPTPAGKLEFSLFTTTEDNLPNIENPSRTVEVEKSDYWTQLSGASDFWVYARFEKPIIPHELGGFYVPAFGDVVYIWLGMTMSAYVDALNDFTSGGQSISTAAANAYYTRDYSNAATSGRILGVTDYLPHVELVVARLVDSVDSGDDTSGYRYRYVSISQSNVETDLSDLDIVVTATGMQDDSSGTITGTPSAVITRPDHALDLIQRRWSGSAWADSGVYDFSEFSSVYSSVFASGAMYNRGVFGVTTGTLEDTIRSLTRDMCSFLVPLNNGKFALYPWGHTPSVVKTFTDEEIEIIGWEIADASSVINDVTIAWGNSYLNPNDQWGATGDYTNKLGVTKYNAGSSAVIAGAASRSQSLFGARVLEEQSSIFIGDVTSASSFCEFMIRTHDMPHWLVSFRVPHYYGASLEAFDCIGLISAELPCFFGANLNGPYPTYAGEAVDLWRGKTPVRAKQYFGQIQGKTIDAQEGAQSTMTITMRVISPYHYYDPTIAGAL